MLTGDNYEEFIKFRFANRKTLGVAFQLRVEKITGEIL